MADKLPPMYKPSKDPTKRKPMRRVHAVSWEGHIITYECKTCERQHRVAMVDPTGKPLGEFAIKFYTRWHSDEAHHDKGTKRGTNGTCPFCRRKMLRDLRKARRAS